MMIIMRDDRDTDNDDGGNDVANVKGGGDKDTDNEEYDD